MLISGSTARRDWNKLLINLLSFTYLAGYALFDASPTASRVGILTAILILAALSVRLYSTGCMVLPKLLLAPLAFVAFAVASTLWAGNTESAKLYAQMIASAACGAIAIWLALYNGLSYRTLVLAAITGSIIVIAASITNPEQMYDMGARSGGTFSNPNGAAIYLTCCALLVTSPYPGSDRISRLNFAIAAIIIASAVYFTGSRKTLFSIGMIIIYGVVAMIWQSKNRLRAYLIPALTCCLVLVTLIILLGPRLDSITHSVSNVGAMERLQAMLQGKDESAETRGAMINTGIRVWQQKPWIGYGCGQYANITAFSTYSHCNYVELLVSTGIVGTLLYYLFYALIAVQALRLKRQRHLAALAIVGVVLLIDIASVSIISKPTWILTVVAAYLAGIKRSIIELSLKFNQKGLPFHKLHSQDLFVSRQMKRVLNQPALRSVIRRRSSNE